MKQIPEGERRRRAQTLGLTLDAFLARNPDIRTAALVAWIELRVPFIERAEGPPLVDRHVLWRMRAYGIEAEGDTAQSCARNWAELARTIKENDNAPTP